MLLSDIAGKIIEAMKQSIPNRPIKTLGGDVRFP